MDRRDCLDCGSWIDSSKKLIVDRCFQLDRRSWIDAVTWIVDRGSTLLLGSWIVNRQRHVDSDSVTWIVDFGSTASPGSWIVDERQETMIVDR